MEERNRLIEMAYLEHYDVLYKKAYARLKNAMDAEDALQDTFELALKYYHTYNPEKAGVGAWVSKILSNACNKILQVQRNKGVSMEFNEEIHGEEAQMTHVGDQLKERIAGHIAEKNSANTRGILSLYFLHNAPMKDIISVIPVSRQYVKQLVMYFRNDMKEIYAD
tara:strand:- start:30525 stop:31022 length:498 start_codon:yes stop_codon:yes gene_type:complete